MNFAATTRTDDEFLGTHSELERVFAGWHAEMLGMLFFLVGSWEVARQCMQETFRQCWQSRNELTGVADVKSWVFSRALQSARVARSAAWQRSVASLDSTQIAYDLDAAAEAQLPYTSCMQSLKAAIGQLPDEEREVFLLRENGHFAYDEIATLLRVSPAVVKSRMRQALGRLQLVTRP